MATFKLVIRLFKTSFFVTFLFYTIALLIVLSVVVLKDSYKQSLQKQFLNKQPHIKLTYISSVNSKSIDIQKEIEKIKSVSSKIGVVSPYITGSKTFSITGAKITGAARYSGDVKIVGVGDREFVYDFYNLHFLPRGEFNVAYTPLFFLYSFRKSHDLVIFNEALFNSFYPVIESITTLEFRDNNKKLYARFAGKFEDYDETPILYTSLQKANQLLGSQNRIDGFFVNAKDSKDIEVLKDELKKVLKNRFVVTSWLEERAKQQQMFNLFNTLSMIVIAVVVFLTVLFVLLLLYNSIVKKSYHLSVLYTLGFYLKMEIFMVLVGIVFFASAISFVLLQNYAGNILSLFELSYNFDIILHSFYYLFFLDILFLFVSYILIDNSYKLKAKSIF